MFKAFKSFRRRKFFQSIAVAATGMLFLGPKAAAQTPVLGASRRATIGRKDKDQQARDYLESILYTPQEVKDLISGTGSHGEKYDPDLGWVVADRQMRNGMDNSISTYRYDPSGARHMIHYANKPCRINTYGDSFTHCDQVSDGETWQEVLAAHLIEPLRNYGVGGYSGM